MNNKKFSQIVNKFKSLKTHSNNGGCVAIVDKGFNFYTMSGWDTYSYLNIHEINSSSIHLEFEGSWWTIKRKHSYNSVKKKIDSIIKLNDFDELLKMRNKKD